MEAILENGTISRGFSPSVFPARSEVLGNTDEESRKNTGPS
jgi:hypothetical protein